MLRKKNRLVELGFFNPLHYGEKLFQQYCVDSFIRIEKDRIRWIKQNQRKLLAANYTTVNDFLDKLCKDQDASIKQKIILPSTCPGAPRFYSECYEDAMALVRRFRSPDLFITMTCNKKWPKIQDALRYTVDNQTFYQSPNTRPYIITRVFKLKSDQLVKDICKEMIFGKVASYVAVIEFQKRGLPHIHLLVILDRNDKLITPEQIDDFICAEIPDRSVDPELYDIFREQMIHNPCGKTNPSGYCMDPNKKKCRFKYPKKFEEYTVFKEDEQPRYRRRDIQVNKDFYIIRKA